MTIGSYRTSSPLRVGPISYSNVTSPPAGARLLPSCWGARSHSRNAAAGSPTSPAPVVTVDPNDARDDAASGHRDAGPGTDRADDAACDSAARQQPPRSSTCWAIRAGADRPRSGRWRDSSSASTATSCWPATSRIRAARWRNSATASSRASAGSSRACARHRAITITSRR